MTATPAKPELRVDLTSWAEGYRALRSVEDALLGADIDVKLHQLVALRVSQMNGCAYCIDMHSKDARALGETEQRLYLLDAWRETAFFTERERAALALAEDVTRIRDAHVPDETIAEAKRHFDDDELTKLLYAIAVANAWNRIAITSRPPVGGQSLPVC
jgi:AhpD family alkylhydroperoxidase